MAFACTRVIKLEEIPVEKRVLVFYHTRTCRACHVIKSKIARTKADIPCFSFELTNKTPKMHLSTIPTFEIRENNAILWSSSVPPMEFMDRLESAKRFF